MNPTRNALRSSQWHPILRFVIEVLYGITRLSIWAGILFLAFIVVFDKVQIEHGRWFALSVLLYFPVRYFYQKMKSQED